MCISAFYFLSFLEMGFHYVAQAGLKTPGFKCSSHLSLPSSWDDRGMSTRLASHQLLICLKSVIKFHLYAVMYNQVEQIFKKRKKPICKFVTLVFQCYHPTKFPNMLTGIHVCMLLILSCRSSNSMKATHKAHGTNSIEMSYSAMNFIEFKVAFL